MHVSDVSIDMGGFTIHLDDGMVVPLESGWTTEQWSDWQKDQLRTNAGDDQDDHPIPSPTLPIAHAGYVFIGTGTATVPIPERADRWTFANRLTLHAGHAPMDLQATVANGSWTTPITQSVIFGLELPEGNQVEASESGRFLRAAGHIVDERVGTMDTTGAWQRLLIEATDDTRRPVLRAQVYTSNRLGVVSTLRPNRPLYEDQWLNVTWDPDARSDAFDAPVVTAGGWKENWGSGYAVVCAIPHTPTREFQAPVEAVMANTTVRVRKNPTNDRLLATSESRLTIRALEPVDVIELSIPRHDFNRRSPDEGWSLDTVTLADGTPLTWLDPEDEDSTKASGWTPLFLPTTLAAGEQVEVIVSWSGGWNAKTANGWSTGLRDIVPALLPRRIGNPWPFVTTVGVPVDSELIAAIGGDTTRTWEEDGWRFVEASSGEGDALWPDIALGDWRTASSAAVDDLPAVDTRLFRSRSSSIQEFAPEVRRVVSFYQGYLPQFPHQELEIVQAPTSWGGFTWIAPHGMVNLQQARTPAWIGSGMAGTPHLESGVLAHEIAHQYFGHVIRPASNEDFWIAESFAETYAVLYLGAAFGEDVLQDRLKRYGHQWERDLRKTQTFASLTRPYSHRSAIIYHWGPYVLLHMLHGRIGNDAFFGAVDGLARNFDRADVRTEDIQAAFELTSGEDLSDFFDFWVRGGFRPELELSWTEQGSQIALDIESSVPFGSFDVPVVVSGESGDVTVWVDVVDGHGQATVDSPGSAQSVDLDPNHMVLATRRRVRHR